MRKRGLGKAAITIGFLAMVATLELGWTVSGGNPESNLVLVTRVVDGDTIRVGRGFRRKTVRLIGVDTPETVHPEKAPEYFGPEASEFTKRSLAGKRVRLAFEPMDRIDDYGRVLAYVFLEDGTLFNRELIRQGYAEAIKYFPYRYKGEFLLLEGEARQNGLGLWGRENTYAPSAATEGRIIGNRRSKIYHLPGQASYYRVSEHNRVYFATEKDALKAGYRRAQR